MFWLCVNVVSDLLFSSATHTKDQEIFQRWFGSETMITKGSKLVGEKA
jgi:hypothetical protein